MVLSDVLVSDDTPMPLGREEARQYIEGMGGAMMDTLWYGSTARAPEPKEFLQSGDINGESLQWDFRRL
jgi:hypothetical protein